MSNKRKATSTKSQLPSVTPACKNNWIFTATLDADAVEKLCLTIFDIGKKLNSEVFEYAIVGTNESMDSKKRGLKLYDVYAYVQIKKHRWTRKELLRHFGVTVNTYSPTELVFGTPEGKWKPNSVVEHIKMVCPSHYTEGGELRKRGSKPNIKKEDSSDSADDDDDIVDEDVEEEEEEEEVEPVGKRAVVARPNPFVPVPVVASSSISQRLNVKPSATMVSIRSPGSNINGLANGRRNIEPTVPLRSNVVVSSRAAVASDGGGRKEFQFQSPFPGLKNDLCKHLEKHVLAVMDSRFSVFFAELEKRSEDHLQLILSEVYKAITDTFGNQVVVDNPEEQEDLNVNPENEICNEDEEKSSN